MKRAVLFDLDGVLLDSQDAVLATLAGFATAALGRRVTVADLPTDAADHPQGRGAGRARGLRAGRAQRDLVGRRVWPPPQTPAFSPESWTA